VKSIRVFLTLTLLSVATLLNFTAALRGYHRGTVEAQALFDRRMREHLDLLNYSLPDLLERGDIAEGKLRFPARELASENHLEFQWLRPDGSLIARSASMPDTAVARLDAGFRFVNFAGYRWHALVAPGADGRSWFILAERDDHRWRMAESIILPAVYPMLLAVPLLGAIIWLLLGLGLRPVQKLARDLEQREASDLSALPTDDVPAELRPLATAANALLSRLEASFARERRLSADAAHELRTPLAALRIQCENLAYRSPDDAAEVARLQAGIDRLAHLVEQILILNRVAPDQYMARFEPIALAPAVRRVIAEYSDVLEAKALDIELVGSDATVRGDLFAIESMLRNLIGNAIKYTPAGGRVRIATGAAADAATLDIDDSGPGIAAGLRERVFDRFYRVGGDCNDSGVAGSGLGLSIVRQVIGLHGARIELRDSRLGSGLGVHVVFPARPQRGAHVRS
jgi:two-component system sensor histidine kinase QseC